MLTNSIKFKNFKIVKLNQHINKKLNLILNDRSEIINSLSKNYKDNYKINKIKRIVKNKDIKLIGMGGSILGSKAIFNFFKDKIKKNFIFIDNLENKEIEPSFKKRKLNLIISKSGNTLETIANCNFLVKKNHKNIFITENKNSYLTKLAAALKAEVIHHNNFIGGRYSVLSEVGMVPAELMGLTTNKFRKFNSLIKDKRFVNSLLTNVSYHLDLIRKKKTNSIILNYDEKSNDLFLWYQQLIAESLGKKGKGVLPIISSMPKDNHSLMQLYLDGLKNNFYTFFFVKENKSQFIKKNFLQKSHFYLKKRNLNEIKYSQFMATQKVFKKKKIPFRSFVVEKRNEEVLGELFVFFMLETILLARALNINPYNQPAVELIKSDTKKILINT